MSNFEFDTAYSAITGEHVPGVYIPYAEADTAIDVDGCDVLLDGNPDNLSEWGQITGKTAQHGYRGAIMHASENPTDDQIREWVREAGGDVFALGVGRPRVTLASLMTLTTVSSTGATPRPQDGQSFTAKPLDIPRVNP